MRRDADVWRGYHVLRGVLAGPTPRGDGAKRSYDD